MINMAAEAVLSGLADTANFLVYVTLSVGVTMGAITLVTAPISRGGAVAVGLIGIIVLVALFAYTVNLIYVVYSQPELYDLTNPVSRDLMIMGVTLQRIAAAQLAAMLFIAGILAISYYLELSRRR